jgi:DNA-binding GntR family transcriptional regulator
MTGASGFNPEEPGYLYEAMAKHLAARIEAGELADRKPLPNERRLAEEYGVSLGTARHAVRILANRGHVVVVRSKGTYVVGGGQRHARRDTAPGEVGPP